MIPWKHRIYAFLLRRVLGPVLDTESLRQLHSLLDVSIVDGRCTLRDVHFRTEFLHEKMGTLPWTVRKARVRELTVHLAFQEEKEDAAWDTLQQASEWGKALPRIALAVKVELNGVLIELEPQVPVPSSPSTATPSCDDTTTQGLLSLYLDAALKSLDLSVEIKDISVRCWDEEENWVELRCQSLSYKTVPTSHSSEVTYETTLHKTIIFQKTSIMVGTGDLEFNRSSVALLEGVNRITLRIIEYKSGEPISTSPCSQTRTETDFEVCFSQKLNISIDAASLLLLRRVAQSYSSHFERDDNPREMESLTSSDLETDCEEDDLEFLNTMMEQYREARQQAERNELRGGVLVPDFLGSKDEVTFDMFFDANDKSFYHYSTLLRESVIMSQNGSQQQAGHAHTRIRLHVKEVGLKVIFSNDRMLTSRRNESYALITVEDIDFSSTIFADAQEHSLAIGRLEMEDSLISVTEDQTQSSRKVEISPILTFLYDSEPTIEKSDDVLVQSPCISFNVRKDRKGLIDIDLELLPLICNCQLNTLARMSCFAADIQPLRDSDSIQFEGDTETTKKDQENFSARISFFCPSIHFELPISKEENWENVFERSSYLIVSPGANTTYFGVDIENILIDVNRKENMSDEDLSLCFDNALVFVSFPSRGRDIDHASRRFDILSLAGRAEIQPTIPVNVKLWQDCSKMSDAGEHSSPSRGEVEFPKVTPISSFKARQDDEDDDARIDRVLCSKLDGVDPSTRRQLRQVGTQQRMIENAAKSTTVIVLSIPELVGDVTSTELSRILLMIRTVSKPKSSVTNSTQGKKKKTVHFASLLVNITSTTLAVHDDPNDSECTTRSFVIKGQGLKIHGVLCGNNLIQGRVLLQDIHFFEVEKMAMQSANDKFVCMMDRVRLLRRRVGSSQESLTRPIFYRSKLFKPISPTSPCVLLDVSIPDRNDVQDELIEIHAQMTLYDITMRFDYDSREWPMKLMAIFPSSSKSSTDSSQDEKRPLPSTYLARLGISLADCNLDYASPRRFKTSSRVIVRLGDLRVSTNMLSPKGPSQSLSVTLGDVSVYLCNNRFPYNFENNNLLGSYVMFQPWQISLDSWQSLSDAEISSGDIQHEMNFRTLLTLDSLDAVISSSNSARKTLTDASMGISLTVGQLALFCCKDSFSIFLGTIAELSSEMSAVDDAGLQALKSFPTFEANDEPFFDSFTDEAIDEDKEIHKSSISTLDLLKQQSAIRPQFATDSKNDRSRDFLLDGYDWTTIDMDEVSDEIPAGEEESARWFRPPKTERDYGTESHTGLGSGNGGSSFKRHSTASKVPLIITHHFRLQPVSNPLGDGDMGASKYSGNSSQCQVKNRLLMHNFSLKVRCFDGYDWPEMLDESVRISAKGSPFVIESTRPKDARDMKQESSEEISEPHLKSDADTDKIEKKTKLMGALLEKAKPSSIFSDLPLPEDLNRKLKNQSEIRRLGRRTSKYIQLSASGIQFRLDTFEESTDHRLASCLDMKINDFFIAETISKDRPTKMVGEWVNDKEHPRNTNDGLAAMKMVTWHGVLRVTPEDEIVSDEAEFALKLLPLRCSLDQRAIRFALAFFSAGDDSDADRADEPLPEGFHAVPPPLFTSFRVRPLKIKVDYKPEKIDIAALKNGAIVELVNLSPLDGMVVTLQEVVINNEVGFGANIGILLRQWIQDVCATQLHKFVTHAAPFQPITHVGRSATDLVVLPWEALQNGESIRRAFRAGTASFTNAVSYETFTLSSRIAEVFASSVASVTNPRHVAQSTGGFSSTLPSRPIHVPRTLSDASQHAVESLSRGLQAASYRIVIVPYREYHRTGAAGAGSSFVRGIPVAIAAPASGVAEALSFSLLAIRNQLRPDILREEEASLKGLLFDDERKDSNRH